MPEGHMIHRAARLQAALLADSPLIIASPQGRFALGAEQLDGNRLIGIDAYGKHLLYRFDSADVLHVHLGLFGKFRTYEAPIPLPRDTVRIRFRTDVAALDLTGPTACELLLPDAETILLARIGPDPLRADADPERFVTRAARSRVAIGSLLLDQSVIAGIGNVYRAEILFLHGISPEREARSLGADELWALWDSSRTLLRDGEHRGRIVTADPKDVGKPRHRMHRDERLYVYRRETCLRCDGVVARTTLANRTMYACANCQT